MRTQKRFTPELLLRYARHGRGTGTFESYVPWHRVGRSDPASMGRSHLQLWRARQRELLSDNEWECFLFASMLPSVTDVREQLPLKLTSAPSERYDYQGNATNERFPGTLEIAEGLGVKHPKVYGKGSSTDWVMTTDLLLSIQGSNGAINLLAVAIKLKQDLDDERKKELLKIESHYWAARGVPWLLITPAIYDCRVGTTLRRVMPWAFGAAANADVTGYILGNVHGFAGRSLTYLIDRVSAEFGDKDLAQRAFWQQVWQGKLRLDLRRGWRPHEPLLFMGERAFWDLNPIASRRTAWVF